MRHSLLVPDRAEIEKIGRASNCGLYYVMRRSSSVYSISAQHESISRAIGGMPMRHRREGLAYKFEGSDARCIVIPIYREEKHHETVPASRNSNETIRYQWEYIFVNDGSPDGSFVVLKHLAGQTKS
jgi:hypothetical protein